MLYRVLRIYYELKTYCLLYIIIRLVRVSKTSCIWHHIHYFVMLYTNNTIINGLQYINKLRIILEFLGPLWCNVDLIVVGFAIRTYHHYNCEFESRSWWGVLDTTLWYIVCQLLAAGGWLFPDIPVSSTNKTDQRDITDISLKAALNTITLTLSFISCFYKYVFVLIHNSVRTLNMTFHATTFTTGWIRYFEAMTPTR